MAPPPVSIDRLLARSSQARLSELLNMVVQGMRAIDDEFGGAMGPNGEAWDQLLDHMFSSSAESGPPPNFVHIAAPADATAQSASDSAPVHPESSTSNAPEPKQTIPANPKPISNLAPTRPNVDGIAAIPAAATHKQLTDDQRQREWRLIVHYMDARAPISQDQLARVHAAFGRWFGWAPSKDEMQKAREVAQSIFRFTEAGPWCSPFATQIWMKASRDQSIAKIMELKKTNWKKADRLAAYIGVTLKQEDKPKPKSKPKQKEAAKDSVSSSAPAMKSLIVKLRVKADALANGITKPQPQPQPQTEPQTALQDRMPSNGVLPEQQKTVFPVSSTGVELPQAPSTQQYLGSDNDFSGYIQQTLPDDFEHRTQASMPTPTGSFGIDPRMTIHHHPMTVYPGPTSFHGQYMDSAPLIEPMSAYPVGIPAAPGWVNPLGWIAERAASLGRSLLPSSQNQANVPVSSSQSAPAAIDDARVDATDIVDIVPAAAKKVLPVVEEADGDADPSAQLHHEMLMHSSADHGADPSTQLHNEMLMHSPAKDAQPENRSENEKQAEKNHVPTPSGPKQQHAVVVAKHNPTKRAGKRPTLPTAKAAEKKSKTSKPAAPHYNYGADVTPDPRANALIAYIVAAWQVTNKQRLVMDAAAMQQLSTHATAAIPALMQDSEAKHTTRGLFRWGDQCLTWEVTLVQIDNFVRKRAQQKMEIEKGRYKGPASGAKPDGTTHIETSSVDAQPIVSTAIESSTTTAKSEAKSRHDPYPDASIVAISGLTPDPRANAFAAHLAESFYNTHGIDLMADEAGSRRLMLHATHNEHRLRGAKVITNYEMNFHDDKDLNWKITGFKLDELEQEWVKRFPPDESDAEDEPEQNEDGDNDGNVEMSGTADTDINKDTNEHAEAQHPSDDQRRDASPASSGLSSVPSDALSPSGRPSPSPCSSSSSSATHSASATSVGSKKRSRSEQPDDTATTTKTFDPVSTPTGALESPLPPTGAANAAADMDNDEASEQQPPVKKPRLSPLALPPRPSMSPLTPRVEQEEEEESDGAAAPPSGSFPLTSSADADQAVQDGGEATGTNADAVGADYLDNLDLNLDLDLDNLDKLLEDIGYHSDNDYLPGPGAGAGTGADVE